MESGFGWTPYNQHLSPEKAVQRWIGCQPKNYQIRYAELRRQLAQAEAIFDPESKLPRVVIRDMRHIDLAFAKPKLRSEWED